MFRGTIRSLERADLESELTTGLVEATADALARSLGESPPPSNGRRRPTITGGDPHAMAQWCANRYQRRRYPALVVGDPHGAAAHLAVALDAPWLPAVAGGRPPTAYLSMITDLLLPGAPVLILTSPRAATDPIRCGVGPLATYAARAGHPPDVVELAGSTTSAAVAQLYRAWLRGAGKTGNRLVVECGPLLDPWHVLRAGLVPYWCPTAGRQHAEAFTWWLVGEDPYSSIEVLLQPPGTSYAAGELERWTSATLFADRLGGVERRCRRAYPSRPLKSRHATKVLRRYPYDLPLPHPMNVADVLSELTSTDPT